MKCQVFVTLQHFETIYIYHTNSETHAVTCYDQHGKQQWTVKNESLLNAPRGFDVDIDGNVYVVGMSSNNVVIVSPEGQNQREVLAAVDGLCSPYSLCFDSSKKQLLVANYYNDAHLFAIM